MNLELQNDPEYLKALLLVTRERLANSLFTITELEAMITMERSKSLAQSKAEDSSADKKQ